MSRLSKIFVVKEVIETNPAAALATLQAQYDNLENILVGKQQQEINGLLARLRKTIQHELGDLLDAVGEPRDARDRLIRTRAQNVLNLIEDESKRLVK